MAHHERHAVTAGVDARDYALGFAERQPKPVHAGIDMDCYTPRPAGAAAEHIPFGEFALASSDVWRSPESQAVYPIAWTIDLPRYGLKLTARAAFENQELRTPESTGVTYWEGSINIEGTAEDKPVAGRGYLEMTGY